MRNHRVGPDTRGLSELLTLAQAGSHEAATAIVVYHDAIIRNIALGIAKRLAVPRQDWDDVVQETYLRLFEPTSRRFFAELGTPESYVHGEALNAVDYAKLRRHARYRGEFPENYTAGVTRTMWAKEDSETAHRTIEAQMTIDSLAQFAEPRVWDALVEIIRSDLSQREAAKIVGLSEFQLCRRIKSLSQTVRVAA